MLYKKLGFLLLLFSVSALWAQPAVFVPTLPVKSYILLNANTGEILAEQAADVPYPSASLTKLMTAYLVYEALKAGRIGLDQMVTISENAWRMGGSQMFIDSRSRVTVDQLLNGLVVQSGNDAAAALAELLGGTEASFAQKMNAMAQTLGLENSLFLNASGLPMPEGDGQMSARDVALLARRLQEDFPEQYYRYSLREYTYNNISQQNRNALLWENFGVDGLKTGFTIAAGYCLAASGRYGDLRLIAVVMGAESPRARVALTRSLLNFGVAQYQHITLFAAKTPLIEAAVYLGQLPRVALVPEEAVTLLWRANNLQALRLEVLFPEGVPLKAPLSTTAAQAALNIYFQDKLLTSWPLYPVQTVEKDGWFGQWWQRWQRFWQPAPKS